MKLKIKRIDLNNSEAIKTEIYLNDDLMFDYQVVNNEIEIDLDNKTLLTEGTKFDIEKEYKNMHVENKNDMKITEETKIKDLIESQFELDDNNVEHGFAVNGRYIMIPIKEKQVKNFEWYINKYLNPSKQKGIDLIDIRAWIDSEQLDSLQAKLKNNNFEYVPFEIKIGLLKFICDDLGIKWHKIIDGIKLKLADDLKYDFTLFRICPEDFLNSIFD